MKKNWLRLVTCLMTTSFLGASFCSSAQNFTISNLFQSGMVLQREAEIPFWGTADAGTKISIQCGELINISTTANADGSWKCSCPAISSFGGPYTMNILVNDAPQTTLTDVYIGDVFYCSGQSNMELTVASCNDYSAVREAANDTTIRQFKVEKGTSYELSDELPTASWKPATSSYVGNFSAAAYFCVLELKKLEEYKNIPIGIINNSYGGARVEAWMSKAMLGYDANDITLAAGEKERQPTLIYNKMVNPLIGIPFKAMLWYQAESNCDVENDAKVYSEQFNNMISSYRTLWNNNFPVIWVQLPNYKSETRTEVDNAPTNVIANDSWITMRSEQTKSLSILDNSAQIVIIDAGLAGNIHPTDKQTVGTRLALAVRKLVYNDATAGYSPQYKSHTLNSDGSVTIKFDNIGDGLSLYVFEKNSSDNTITGKAFEGDTVTWLQVTDVNGKSYLATAKLQGDSVVVLKKDADIKTVYYAWNRCPGGMNLYSHIGDTYLPAAPFKFDVETAEFGIQSFTSTKGEGSLQAEGGNFVTFTWTTGGNVTAYFNDVKVDANTSAKVMLSETKDYTLKIVNNDNPTQTESKTISFMVVPAKPTIKLSSQSGLLANPADQMNILSNAAAPGGFSVAKVDWYLNGEFLETSTTAPFSLLWTAPSQTGDYEFYGIVYNNNSDEQYNHAQSETLTITVTNVAKTRYEAEDAQLIGGSGCTIKDDDFCSGGKYYDLQVFKRLVFSDIYAPNDGTYQICIAYMTNYCEEGESKQQKLYVNTTSAGTIEFSSKDWTVYKATVNLKKGQNTITILNSWGWMSFDYIEILGVTKSATAIETVTNDNQTLAAFCDTQSQIVINYISDAATVKFEITDIAGKTMYAVADVQNKGQYVCETLLPKGTYIVTMIADGKKVATKVIVK